MEGILEEYVITESISHENKKSEKLPDKPERPPVPRSADILCFSLFFLLGICHFIPITFLSAANNFWLYKFRNVTEPDQSAENRTRLQVNFATAKTIVDVTAGLLCGFFNITVSHRFKMLRRIMTCLTIELVIFVLLTISVEVNTNNVQLLYFIGVLSAAFNVTAANTINILATVSLFPRFPIRYMSACLVGQGAAGIIGDILNIVSIGIFNNDVIKGTFLYFSMGCFIMLTTIVLLFFASRTEFFKESVLSIPENVDKKMHSIKELKSTLCKIKYPLIVLLYDLMTTLCTHTSITSLVVSEQYKEETVWANTYFSPVITFLLSDVFVLLGRIYVGVSNFDLSKKMFYILCPIRAILVPFIWMCNAQPRKHLPVLFHHDYQYGIILVVFMFTNGILLHWATSVIPKFVEKHESDVAYAVFMFVINVVETMVAPLTLLIVNFL